MLFVYFGTSKLEKLFQPNRYAELFYLILVNSFFLLILSYFLSEIVMAKGLAFSFLYIWCKRSPFEKIQFMFGFIFSSKIIIFFNFFPYFMIFSNNSRRIFAFRSIGLPSSDRNEHFPGTGWIGGRSLVHCSEGHSAGVAWIQFTEDAQMDVHNYVKLARI